MVGCQKISSSLSQVSPKVNLKYTRPSLSSVVSVYLRPLLDEITRLSFEILFRMIL